MVDKVVLGIPGPWARDYRESADHYTTKIGGIPDWPFAKEELRTELLQCGLCGNTLCLVAQVFAPISSKDLRIEERVIYVFGCVMPNCGSNSLSWRAIRVQNLLLSREESSSFAQKVASDSVAAAPVSSDKCLEKGECGEEKSDLGIEDGDMEASCREMSEAATLASCSKKRNSNRKRNKRGAKNSSLKLNKDLIKTPVVPCFYICYQEDLSSGGTSNVSSNLSALSLKGNRSDTEEEMWEGERYEYDKALYADRTYLKFKKRLDAYPEQCFRYLLGGKPLLATKELEKPGNCKSCGAPRHYEMQLMPPLLYFLHEASGDDSSTQSMEDWSWMTLVVYTCSKSCSDLSNREKHSSAGWDMVEEAVIVQFEKPLQGSARLSYF